MSDNDKSTSGSNGNRPNSSPPRGEGSGVGGNGGTGPAGPGGTIFNQPPPAGHAKKMSEVLGEIVWLMSQSPLHGAVLHPGPRVARRASHDKGLC